MDSSLDPVSCGAPIALRPVPVAASDDPMAFGVRDYLDAHEEADGLFHVTTNLPAVLRDGLKSRRQLGGTGVGLGGGPKNEAPHRVSVTYTSRKAAEITWGLRLGARAARAEARPSELLHELLDHFGLPDDCFGFYTARLLRRHGALPARPEGDRAASWGTGGLEDLPEDHDIEAALDARGMTGPECYTFLQDLEAALTADAEHDETPPPYVGLTATWERMAALDPARIATLRVAARAAATPELVPHEWELRFDPEDLTVIAIEATAPELASHDLAVLIAPFQRAMRHSAGGGPSAGESTAAAEPVRVSSPQGVAEVNATSNVGIRRGR